MGDRRASSSASRPKTIGLTTDSRTIPSSWAESRRRGQPWPPGKASDWKTSIRDLTRRCSRRAALAAWARRRAVRARLAAERRSVSEPRNSKSLKAMGSGHSTRWCASDRLVAARNSVDLGGVGVAASGTHGGAGARPKPGDRCARHASARLIGRRIQRRRCRVVPVAACGGRSQRRMTYANIPLEPTRPASDSRAGLTAQRAR